MLWVSPTRPQSQPFDKVASQVICAISVTMESNPYVECRKSKEIL